MTAWTPPASGRPEVWAAVNPLWAAFWRQIRALALEAGAAICLGAAIGLTVVAERGKPAWRGAGVARSRRSEGLGP